MKSYQAIFFFLLCSLSATRGQLANCLFDIAWHGGYVCRFVNANFTNQNQQFVIGGIHLPGKTDSDVVEIETENCVFNYFPQQIFDRFQNLRFVDLNDLQLLEFHQPWRNCNRLIQIVIRHNKLQRIPGRIFAACTNVYWVSIEHEYNLTEIDDHAFAGLSTLFSVHITNAPLSELRAEMIRGLSQTLLAFSIQSTNIQEVPANAFRSLRNLDSITLRDNQLTTIHTGAFNDLARLDRVFIEANSHLSNIEPDAFVGLPNLGILSFRVGNLSELRTNSFSALPNLHMLDISTNGLAKVERNFFDNFPNLRSLYASYGNECVNTSLADIPNQRQELYKLMEECFTRFDAIPPTTSTEAPTTTEETTTLGASTITLSLGLVLSCILIITLVTSDIDIFILSRGE